MGSAKLVNRTGLLFSLMSVLSFLFSFCFFLVSSNGNNSYKEHPPIVKAQNPLIFSDKVAKKLFGLSYNPLILKIVFKTIDNLNITTIEEASHLFGQLACESARFKSIDGRYDPNKLDGWKYHGRGIIQLTGLRNYKKAEEALKIIFVGNSKEAIRNRARLIDPTETALNVKVLSWYWETRVRTKKYRRFLYKINHYSILQVTRSIHDPEMSFKTIRGEKITKYSKWHKKSYWYRVKYTKRVYNHYLKQKKDNQDK